MTDDEQTERRLRAMLQGRAERVEPTLTGPDLRRRSVHPDRSATARVRRLAPALAAAAAVVVIATVAAVAGRDDGPGERLPVPPGRQPAVSVPAPAPPGTSTPPPSAVPGTPSAPMAPTPTRVPTRSPSGSNPPRPTTTAPDRSTVPS